MEPAEAACLGTPEGALSQQDTINCVWRLEGLAVLAWALGLAKLPRYDELVSLDELMDRLAFLDSTGALKIIEEAQHNELIRTTGIE